MDWNISDRDQVRGRYLYNKNSQIDAGLIGVTLPVFYTTIAQPYHLVAFSEYHTFSPSVTNEFRVGFNRFAQDFTVPDLSYLPTLDGFPNLTFDDLGGLNIGPDPNAPQFNIQNTYQAVDNLTWTKRRPHSEVWGRISEGDFAAEIHSTVARRLRIRKLRNLRQGSDPGRRSQRAQFRHRRLFRRSVRSVLVRKRQLEIPAEPDHQPWFALRVHQHPIRMDSAEPQQSLFCPGPDQFRVAESAYQGLHASRRICLYSRNQRQHFDSRWFRHGLRRSVRQHRRAVAPAQIGNTVDCPTTCAATGFLANGGIPLQNTSGITNLDQQTARGNTSSFLPENVKYPLSLSWNLGVQHVFKSNYTAEVRYVGTRGEDLSVQTRNNIIPIATPNHHLPTYIQAPSQATVDAQTLTLGDLNQYSATGYIDPAYRKYPLHRLRVPEVADSGRKSPVTVPWGSSTYHGLQTQLNRGPPTVYSCRPRGLTAI